MTCVVYDGVTLAADKMVSFGYLKMKTTKIYRVGANLVAITGNGAMGSSLLKWYEDGAKPETYPSENRKDDQSHAHLIVINGQGRVYKYESGPYPTEVETVPCAFGAGGEAAMGAIYMGANAAQAVAAANRYIAGCGEGIDTLTLVP